MNKTITISEEQYNKIKDLIEEKEIQFHAVKDLVGTNVFIRTVTHYFTGHVEAIDGQFVILSQAAWVADTGRYADALKNGDLSEVEPIGNVMVNLSSVIDITPWINPLPLVQK